MSEPLRVLFLCTGNSARSQIAEGWARKLHAENLVVASAGTVPVGINPRAVQVMAERGVDISRQSSDHVDLYKEMELDAVVTLCDSAQESCPVFPGAVRVLHHPFPDPAQAAGSDEEILRAFRDVRDQIRSFIAELPERLREGAPE